jgi:hypothetical protein
MKEIYISTDIEADGPIPGPHSMLSIGWAAYTAHKVLVSTFSANVETLSDAQPHPKTCRMVGKAARGMGRLSQRSGACRARDDAIRDLDQNARWQARIRCLPRGGSLLRRWCRGPTPRSQIYARFERVILNALSRRGATK